MRFEKAGRRTSPILVAFVTQIKTVKHKFVLHFLAGLLLVLSGRTREESALSLGIDIELMDRPVLAIRQPNLVDADKTRLRCREQDVGDG